jgi:hypothetical protein
MIKGIKATTPKDMIANRSNFPFNLISRLSDANASRVKRIPVIKT